MNITHLSYMATTEAATDGSVISALGIDVKLLIFQSVAFLILVWFVGKFILPVFVKLVDKRQADIEASSRAAVEASKQAEKVQAEVDSMLRTARKEATEIVTTAKDEANAMLTKAEEKSKAQAETIIASAQDEIAKEVIAAKKTLHNETIELIADATEKVVGKAVDAKIDKNIVAKTLERA